MTTYKLWIKYTTVGGHTFSDEYEHLNANQLKTIINRYEDERYYKEFGYDYRTEKYWE